MPFHERTLPQFLFPSSRAESPRFVGNSRLQPAACPLPLL
jgi:hypothetical protein